MWKHNFREAGFVSLTANLQEVKISRCLASLEEAYSALVFRRTLKVSEGIDKIRKRKLAGLTNSCGQICRTYFSRCSLPVVSEINYKVTYFLILNRKFYIRN